MARLSADEVRLDTIRPKLGARQASKRIGRGGRSGTGKTSGRGHKGAGARAGASRNAAFEGGQNPIHEVGDLVKADSCAVKRCEIISSHRSSSIERYQM